MKNIIYTIICLCFVLMTGFSQNTKGLYVNDFKYIVGDSLKEDSLLQFSQANGFNYLLLYNLYYIHQNLFDITDSIAAVPLANFIEKAKTQFGVVEVGAVGEKFASFNTIDQYNQTHSNQPNQQFDVYHIEFEFWNNNIVNGYYCNTYLTPNNLPCDTSGAFSFYIDQMIQLQALTLANGLKAETFIGKPTAGQSQQLGAACDRVLVHYYRKSDTYNNGNSIYNYQKYRLPDLAPQSGTLAILPIFSSRSNHMGPWLLSHPEPQAFDTYLNGQNGYNAASGSWKNHLVIEGYQWYRHTDLESYMSQNSSLIVFEDERSLEEQFTIGEANNLLMGKEKEPINTHFSFHPNPASKVLWLKIPINSEGQIRLMDVFGNVVLTKNINSSESTELNIASLKSGTYFLEWSGVQGKKTQKLTVIH